MGGETAVSDTFFCFILITINSIKYSHMQQNTKNFVIFVNLCYAYSQYTQIILDLLLNIHINAESFAFVL